MSSTSGEDLRTRVSRAYLLARLKRDRTALIRSIVSISHFGQRRSNENTNGLLRQYFPKGTDLSHFSQAYLNKIALRLNQRPRKTLGFETPADRLRAVLQ